MLHRSLTIACCLLLSAGLSSAQTPQTRTAALSGAQSAPESRTASLKNASGQVIGQVTVTQAANGVLLQVQAKGLSPGWHGMHFHEKADCSDPKFQNSGAHLHANPPAVHGLLNPAFNDAGDLPNLYVSGDGSATAELYSSLVTFKATDTRPALLDADGAALVIHAKPDDHKSQPIGNSGDRIACAPLQ